MANHELTGGCWMATFSDGLRLNTRWHTAPNRKIAKNRCRESGWAVDTRGPLHMGGFGGDYRYERAHFAGAPVLVWYAYE